MALRDDALTYEAAFLLLAAAESAHDATGVSLAAVKSDINDAFNVIQVQFAVDGEFTRVFEDGAFSIVINSVNGLLTIDVVTTE